ncbi:hypothetical protein AB0D32_03475 [Micromonospora sp. NPDC048170]|uniref:hypothetical protein n=1 Tax=Micromonospora sp. NPDC048170 TaxID=3154819 RepID=UPI0033CB03AF
MSFRTETTLVGYARAVVEMKTRIHEYCTSTAGGEYTQAFVETLLASRPEDHSDEAHPHQKLTVVINRASSAVWAQGEAYVLAPAMTAVVAAAAEVLDLTGDLLTADAAPTDGGVLFLPEPIYDRNLAGQVSAIAAITWATIASPRGWSWLICGWANRDDPEDPHATRIQGYARQDPILLSRLGPYVMTDMNLLPIAAPVPAVAHPDINEPDRDWETAPDGRYVIADATARIRVCAAIAYGFWRIQAQPISVAAPAFVDRPTRRRAARASIVHHTRVRFVVRRHWRRLIDKHGQAQRNWVPVHLGGPEDAPLLHGEKVAVPTR